MLPDAMGLFQWPWPDSAVDVSSEEALNRVSISNLDSHYPIVHCLFSVAKYHALTESSA